MSTKEAAERACKEPNPIIDGRKANVNLAILGAKPRGNLTGNQLSIYFAQKLGCIGKNVSGTRIRKINKYWQSSWSNRYAEMKTKTRESTK